MERSDRQHQPIADTQSRFTIYVTPACCQQSLQNAFFGSGAAMEVPSLYCGLPTVPQGACRGYGTIRPATPTDCRYAESIHHICHTGLLPAEPPKRIFRVWGRHGGPILVLRATHSATGCVPWVWNDQTGNTNRLPIRRVDSPYMSPACCQQSLQNAFFGSGAAMEVPSLY